MNGPIEPDADTRMAASAIRQCFLALCQEGFTEQQAIAIVGQVIAAQIGGKR